MKRLFLLLIPILAASCATAPAPKNVTELEHKEEVYEVISHLYRWYLDEVDVQLATKAGNSIVWVRELNPKLDKDDKSRFAEMLLPVVGVKVRLKKTDYEIEEIGLKVNSGTFKITRVSRLDFSERIKKLFSPVEIDRDELRKYLFKTRSERTYPDEKMIERLRTSVRTQVHSHLESRGLKMPEEDQAFHIAPLSPVANELWVFWENGRMLIHFSSDIGIDNPYVWEHDELSATIYDIDDQVVVSLQEVAGSNAYLTRDQVGRALYNCVVLGKRIEITPRR